MSDTPAWATLPLFRGVSDDNRARLADAMEPVWFSLGSVLIEQGAVGDEMFIVESGHVRVVVRGPGGDTLFETTLSGPALVGEMALVTREARSATVTAETPVRALRVKRAVLDDLLARHPQAASFLTTLVGERLMETHGIRRVGKYEVLGALGAGAVATVFEARHPELDQTVALKMLSHALVYNRAFADHFDREARIVASLNHEHIVRVLDTAAAYGTRFIVMERLKGELLEGTIRRGDVLDWNEVRRILAEIAAALAYSHGHGLIHRDVKPSNVFMTENGHVKLLDFGVAVSAGVEAGRDRTVFGTPYYMSPEQIRGLPLDGRSDLYSLGVLAFELCTHQRPFAGDSLRAVLLAHLQQEAPDARTLVADLPDDVAEFLRRSLARDREARFGSCEDAERFLREHLTPMHVGMPEAATLGVAFLPAQRDAVMRVLGRAAQELQAMRGVRVAVAPALLEALAVAADDTAGTTDGLDATMACETTSEDALTN